jgi:hypothetical protein
MEFYEKTIIVNKKLTFNSGINWLKSSFITFREQPLQFMTLEFFAIIFSFLPLIGSFLQPLFSSRFLLLANNVEMRKHIFVKDIFVGLFSHSNLMRLSFINFLFNVCLLLANYIFKINSNNMFNILLFTILPTFIITMLIWFAPVLCIFDDLQPFHAMRLSFKAVSSNLFAMLIFSIVIFAISILLLVPLLLLFYWIWNYTHSFLFLSPIVLLGLRFWFIWGSILNITVYFSYKDLFIKYSK